MGLNSIHGMIHAYDAQCTDMRRPWFEVRLGWSLLRVFKGITVLNS